MRFLKLDKLSWRSIIGTLISVVLWLIWNAPTIAQYITGENQNSMSQAARTGSKWPQKILAYLTADPNTWIQNVTTIAVAFTLLLILTDLLKPRRMRASTGPAISDQTPDSSPKTVGELMLSTLKEAEAISSLVNKGLPKGQQLRQSSPKEKRDAAIKLGGIRGAKALIEIEIECIPTHPSGHESGEWKKWVNRMAALLGSLLKPKFKIAFLKCVESIDGPDNSAPMVKYHLRGVLNNLNEEDLKATRIAVSDEQVVRDAIPDDAGTHNRVRQAQQQIRELAKLICPYAMDAFVPGVAREKQNWRTQTLAGLRAVVKHEFCEAYSEILKGDSPKQAAIQFLNSLADTLTESH
jgi:hypothetical protein